VAVELAFEYGIARFIDFRDSAECDRVRRISRTEIAQHANPDFRIRVVDEPAEFYEAFATDLVDRIRAARDESRTFVAILPVGPMPQYELAVRLINAEQLSLARAELHVANATRARTSIRGCLNVRRSSSAIARICRSRRTRLG